MNRQTSKVVRASAKIARPGYLSAIDLELQELCVDIWYRLIQHMLPADDQLRIFGMIFLNHLKVFLSHRT